MGVFDMIHSFLNPDEGYKKAGNQYEQYWNEGKGYEMPFQKAGSDELSRFQDFIKQLGDPEGLENKWASGYQASPYAQRMMREAQDQGMTSASQQGLLGSSAAVKNVETTASNVGQQFRQQYLDDLMKKYLSGASLSKGLVDTGAGAGANLTRGALQTGSQMGEAAFGEANAPGELFSSILGNIMGWKGSGTGEGGSGGSSNILNAMLAKAASGGGAAAAAAA